MISPGYNHLQENRITEMERQEILENFDKEMEKGPNAQGLVNKIKFTVIIKCFSSYSTSINYDKLNSFPIF